MSLQSRYRKYPVRYSFGPGSRQHLTKQAKAAAVPVVKDTPAAVHPIAQSVHLPLKGLIAWGLLSTVREKR